MVLDKWKMELRVKKFKVDISANPRLTLSTIPIITPKAEADYSFPTVKGEDYENLVNVFETCTLRCLINGVRRLLIFQFFSEPPLQSLLGLPVYQFSRNAEVQLFFVAK